jgi:DNA-binding CsgD family transcriptional regulator
VARLTPSQSAVAELAALGLSNQTIASQRGTSRRTVAHQLTIAYAKLGVTGRRELCARAGRPVILVAGAGTPPLSEREQEVVVRAGLGQSNKVIAFSLGRSVSTVSTLLSRARRKLDTPSEQG